MVSRLNKKIKHQLNIMFSIVKKIVLQGYELKCIYLDEKIINYNTYVTFRINLIVVLK
jgi:tmRNA-binding protein